MTNQIVLTGNLGGPIELRYAPNSGDPVANFSLADTPRRFNKQTNEWEDAGETLWARCSIWGAEAEALAQAAGDSKGRVTVVGRAGWEVFQRRDGSEGGAFTIKATAATFHPPKQQQGQPQQQYQQPAGGQFGSTVPGAMDTPAAQDPWGGSQPATGTPPF